MGWREAVKGRGETNKTQTKAPAGLAGAWPWVHLPGRWQRRIPGGTQCVPGVTQHIPQRVPGVTQHVPQRVPGVTQPSSVLGAPLVEGCAPPTARHRKQTAFSRLLTRESLKRSERLPRLVYLHH